MDFSASAVFQDQWINIRISVLHNDPFVQFLIQFQNMIEQKFKLRVLSDQTTTHAT